MSEQVYSPFYWLNEESRIFLSRGYLSEKESPEDRINEIAKNAETILKIEGFAKKFVNYMSKGFYSLATPVWTNFGKKSGLPVSCFGSFVPDSTDQIFEKIGEIGMMSKMGGGTSGYFGDVRPRGSIISTGGKTDGPVRFMELFDKTADVINQGSARRGSFAAYLPVEHPDVLDFLKIRSDGHPIQNMSIAVTITNDWMKSMIGGDKSKREIWAKIIQKRFESGYPYVTFIDNINDNNPQCYKDKNLTVKAQNLCVSGDQRVPSNFGLLTAKELYDIGKELELFDNDKKVSASKMELIEKNADTYKITLENGMTHTVTGYHKVKCNVRNGKKIIGDRDVECQNLKPGDFVAIQTNKGVFGSKNMPKEAFLLGMYQGDGTQCSAGICIPQWIWESDEQTHWQYIRGLLYTDGTAFVSKSKGSPIQVSLASINRDWLAELQILFNNLGLQSSIRLLRKSGSATLPDGNGSKKEYPTKTAWRLIVGNKNDCLELERNTGFLSRKKIQIDDRAYQNNTKKYYKIVSIDYVGKQDVFCCTVDSLSHHWVCNGIITHNCNEIALHSDENHSFVCVLSSLNLLHWDEIVKTDAIETLIYFLDAVNEEFIRKSANIKFMQSAHRFAKEHRALGAGVLGWHSFLQSRGVPFESMSAKLLNNSIWKTIRERADSATQFLAKHLGEPEALKGYGRRNTHTLAVAPTTSSSFILGQISPSIEPLNSNYFVKNLAKGSFTYKNPFLKNVLQKYSQDSQETWKSILTKGGSVQHLKFLSQEERDTFKTFGEISQKEIIIQASQRQKYIDQGQSLNIMVPLEVSAKEVSQLMIYAWENGIKGLYYQRGANPAQELSRTLNECKSCES
jgi:ribonucleoside-diphosphate reductase alpha chain